MKQVPDLNQIGSAVLAWQGGVATSEETVDRIRRLLEPGRWLPEAEVVALPVADECARQMVAVMERLEQKVNLLLTRAEVSVPSGLDPRVLSAEVRKLVFENRKIEAVSLHRRMTGAGLAVTMHVINAPLQQSTDTAAGVASRATRS